MHRAPALQGQRHHGRAPHRRKDPDGLLDGRLGQVHQQVLLVLAEEVGVDAEEHLVQERLRFGGKVWAGDQDRLAAEDGLDLLQAVLDQGPAGGDDVEDGVGDAGRGRDLHRSGDDLHARLHAFPVEEALQDAGVGGRDPPAGEARGALIDFPFGNGEAEAAAAEAEFADHGDAGGFLFHLIEAYDAEGGHPRRDDAGDVVVAQIEDFGREIPGPRKELAPAFVDPDADFREQPEAFFVQSSLGLDCNA